MILEGRISVKAALLGKNREVYRLWVRDTLDDRDTRFIVRTAEQMNVPVHSVPAQEIDCKASGRTHGGILAETGSRKYQSLENALNCGNPFAVLLEGVEDPFNLGYVIRSLYSAGCTGLILRNRSWENAESTIVRSSAGASEYINLIMTEDPAETLRELKQHGLYAYAAMRKDAVSYFDADFTDPVVLCIGGEMRGLSSAVLKECDQNIYIPYANDFRAALNAAGASAALGFEVMRQRSRKG
ncbi:MAG: RNA methyltransferase [Erysipelotrichaceae bacterium]|nr:RNA methyltransferase [Erysipelotrichaceae bacterium]